MSRTDIQTNIRLPPELKNRLLGSARAAKRTMGAEIVHHLQRAVAPDLMPDLPAPNLSDSTRRERISIVVMQALIAGGYDVLAQGTGWNLVCKSVAIADCMMAELDRVPEAAE